MRMGGYARMYKLQAEAYGDSATDSQQLYLKIDLLKNWYENENSPQLAWNVFMFGIMLIFAINLDHVNMGLNFFVMGRIFAISDN